MEKDILLTYTDNIFLRNKTTKFGSLSFHSNTLKQNLNFPVSAIATFPNLILLLAEPHIS